MTDFARLGPLLAFLVACGGSAPTSQAPTPGLLPPAEKSPAPEAPTPPAAAATINPPSSDLQLFQGAGFTYSVPQTWQKRDASTIRSPLVKASHRSVPVPGQFVTNINVATEPFTGDTRGYAAANEIELRVKGGVTRQGAAHAGEREAWDIECFWKGAGGDHADYTTLQRYLAVGANGWVITCSMPHPEIPSERATCQQILDTFRVE